MKWRWEKEDHRFTRVAPVIEMMVAGAAEICTALCRTSPEYWPFHDNEAAGVSLLAGGAARRGGYPVCEYPVEKKTWDAVRRKYGQRASKLKPKHLMNGRADLCVLHQDRYFSFEFKRTSERWDRTLGPKGFRTNLEYFHEYAVEEIDRIHDDEYHHVMAGVIAPVFENTREDVIEDFFGEVNLALSIGSRKTYKVYFLFSSLSAFEA